MSTSKKIKCVVWDLDNTIWDGVLLEDTDVKLKEGIEDIIRNLDDRGILQSIASKNNEELAIKKLKEFGLYEYFIYPQINWNSKSSSIKEIVTAINIGINTIAFVDDQVFERDEVLSQFKEVLCIDAANIKDILNMDEMNPTFITEDSKLRRKMYMSDIKRNKVEEIYSGPKEEFLKSLNMVFQISLVGDEDIQRAEELTVRTHQLNTTGYTYSYEELDNFRKSKDHKLFIASLDDKYGTYGKIGLVLVECNEDIWCIKLLLMSCRVVSRGVGSILLNHIMKLAKESNVKLRAEFINNDRNRMMYVTYKFAGFKDIGQKDNHILFENTLEMIQETPSYVAVEVS
ncbi:HAD-IIIC family phosphatase [Paraclostridium ghonii]|uniref:FkbH-like protein n=1 Tax=Paraclostridium ghonii TaxID=29358 RepID=A0ABU0N038_9FIRM|nr:HAD-IIIC family phosphatase [Paeniclostridium ghonii]MDQ0556522.1 FkbH-like protein [Paeniclostridium ghonii]